MLNRSRMSGRWNRWAACLWVWALCAGEWVGLPAHAAPVPTSPILSARRSGNGALELTWPTDSGAFLAEAATNSLAAPVGWTPLDGIPVTLSSNDYMQAVSPDRAHQFYRLAPAPVDNTSLIGKSMMGYQGWYASPEDGTDVNKWFHWGHGNPLTSWTIDFWPDLSECTAEERYDTGWMLRNGDPAELYSAAHPKTVYRHFRWMWDYGIDGVFLQRFLNEVNTPKYFDFRNQVARNVQAGAEAYQRVFAIMYDISGTPENDLLARCTNDWIYLNQTMNLTNSPSYLHHNDKPVIAIWGLGFTDRPGTPPMAMELINFFKDRGMTVMGGVPGSWRTLTSDSKTDPSWTAVYQSFDIISPWTVGRYTTISEVNAWRVEHVTPDLAAATAAGVEYMPVIWPGFSWYNLHGSALNKIPRLGGDFYWRQAYSFQRAGSTMMYTAMFDEVDEGTAMFKLAATTNELPVGVSMVPLDIDGTALPSDWYLRVAGEATRMLRGETPLQSKVPITP